MRYLSFIVGLVAVCAPLPSFSDTQHSLLGYKCDPNNEFIEFRYFYYENDEEVLQPDDIDISNYEVFDPWELVKIREDEKTSKITDLIEVEKICEIKDTKHLISILPGPGNRDLLGRCGGQMSVKIEIYIPPWYALENRELYGDEKGNIVLKPFSFEGDCHDSGGFITKSLTFDAEKLITTTVNVKRHGRFLYE